VAAGHGFGALAATAGRGGELVAKLFDGWYEPIHLQDVTRVSDN
jgi:hypothetical protein